MKFAYADPPYLGCGHRYLEHHPEALDWDDPATHQELVDRLVGDPDLRSRTEALGDAIRSADGISRAADLIEAAARNGSAR